MNLVERTNGITFVDFYITFTWQNEWQEHVILFICTMQNSSIFFYLDLDFAASEFFKFYSEKKNMNNFFLHFLIKTEPHKKKTTTRKSQHEKKIIVEEIILTLIPSLIIESLSYIKISWHPTRKSPKISISVIIMTQTPPSK